MQYCDGKVKSSTLKIHVSTQLTAAALAVKIAVQLREELDMEVHDEVFWTDSRVILGYIQNAKKTFKTFVANRIN